MRLPPHVPGEAIVRLRTGRGPELGTVVERFELTRTGGELARVRLPENMDTAAGLTQLNTDPAVEYAVPNQIHRPHALPNDLPEDLWGLAKINAERAWDRTTGTRTGPIVAVLDTGCDVTHPDLVNNLWTNPGEIPGNGVDDDENGVVDDVHGYNAIDNSGNLSDDYDHGTHCAGTVAAEGNNGQGVTGVNWQAQVMPIKFMDADGNGTTAALIRGVLYAERMGAKITSNSYGGEFNRAEYEVFREASNTLHLCAAGNEGRDNDVGQYYLDRSASYPATYDLPHIVSVGASSRRDRLASFSNYGAKTVDLAAPGTSILSTVPGGGYATKSGTSMATPHVAGAATLIATLYPEATPAEIKARLLNSATPLPGLQGQVLTGGQLNAAAALEPAGPPPPPPGLKAGPPTWEGLDLESLGPLAIEADGEHFTTKEVRLWPSATERNLTLQARQADWSGQLSEAATLEVTVPAAHIAYTGGDEPFTVEAGAKLFLDGDFDLQPAYDELLVEIKQDGQWTTAGSFTGRGQRRETLSLERYAGQTVQLRLREVLEGPGTGVRVQRVAVAAPMTPA